MGVNIHTLTCTHTYIPSKSIKCSKYLGDGGLRGVVGRVVVEVRDGVDQAVGVARLRHAHLLAGHELEGAMRAEVEDRVGAEDLGVLWVSE